MCVCVCTCSVGQDDHGYSTVDDVQQQMFALASNPSYEIVSEQMQQPLEQDDQAYYNIGISQKETVVTSRKPEHGTALGATASTK